MHILLAEDDNDDVALFRLALDQIGGAHQLEVFNNGASVATRLENMLADGDALRPDPDIIFLDLNMPLVDGHATLKRLKADETMRHIPVVVLSTSGRRESVQRAYEAGANAYFVKPGDLREFVELIRSVLTYWLKARRMSA